MHYFIDFQIFLGEKKFYLIRFSCSSWIFSVISAIMQSKWSYFKWEKMESWGPNYLVLLLPPSKKTEILLVKKD